MVENKNQVSSLYQLHVGLDVNKILAQASVYQKKPCAIWGGGGGLQKRGTNIHDTHPYLYRQSTFCYGYK